MIFHSIYNKPILLVGSGVRSSHAVDLLHEFANTTKIPILTSMNGVDLAQGDFHIGFIGTHGNRVANLILNECDLIIAIGIRLGLRQVGKKLNNFAPNAHLVRADIDEYELSRDIKPQENKYHLDAKDFLKLLLSENVGDYTEWYNKCLNAKHFLDNYDITEGNRAVKTISDLLPDNPIIACDVGQNQCWCAQSLHLKGDKGRIHIGGGYGTMGCGLPYAIGSSIAIGKGKVYCICGDGDMQMNIQELETVVREKLPVKILILNNRVLGKINETQHFNLDNRFTCTAESGGYSIPNFEKIAAAYGLKSAKLDNYLEINSYKEWLYDNEPCLLNISLSPQSFLEPKIKFDTGITNPILPDEVLLKACSYLK